jgi:rsbT co-antagonist protein RsbR
MQQTRRDILPIDAAVELRRELVAHLRENRTGLREEWVRRITETQLLRAMTNEEVFAEATSVYDNYVEALETDTLEALQSYARSLSERIIPRGVETDEVVGIVLLLRDVLARSLFGKYQNNPSKLNRVLDAYEPAANRIANTVAVGSSRNAGASSASNRRQFASSRRRCSRCASVSSSFRSSESSTHTAPDS